MDIHILHNLLTPAQLTAIRETAQRAKWTDGKVSGGKGDNKNNEELVADGSASHIDILKMLELAVRDSPEFQMTAWPRYMTRPIISRYDEGMYYKAHTDFPVQNFHITKPPAYKALTPVGTSYIRTDLSITLFLSDPQSYTGGELCFEQPGSEMVRYKLPAGSAVVYPTGVPHSVARVTRGVRFAAVFWVQSMFPNEVHRRAVRDASQLYVKIEGDMPDSALSQMAECNFHNVFRLFAEV